MADNPPSVSHAWGTPASTSFDVTWNVDGPLPTKRGGAWLLQLEHQGPDRLTHLGTKFVGASRVTVFRWQSDRQQESFEEPAFRSTRVLVNERQITCRFPLDWFSTLNTDTPLIATVSWSTDGPTDTYEVPFTLEHR